MSAKTRAVIVSRPGGVLHEEIQTLMVQGEQALLGAAAEALIRLVGPGRLEPPTRPL